MITPDAKVVGSVSLFEGGKCIETYEKASIKRIPGGYEIQPRNWGQRHMKILWNGTIRIRLERRE